MDLSIVLMIVKMAFLMAWLYGLLWALNRPAKWQKAMGVVLAWGIVQLFLSLNFGDFQIFSDFDRGLLFQSCTMAMVVLGLNLIYGYSGQFSLGQWGFYGVGAYVAADITFRWVGGDTRGLVVAGIGTILTGLAFLGVGRFLRRRRGIPVLSAFTFYLLAAVVAGAVAVLAGGLVNPLLAPLMGTAQAPGFLRGPVFQQVVFALAILIAGLFAAELSFLFGLPILTLGSDYFGIATLGFSIVLNTLMLNSDTILPFPEMKGGRGMIGIPQLTSWPMAFGFLLLIIVAMRNLIHSSTGRAIMAVREDEVATKAMGINVADSKLLAFVVGSLFAGIGGAIYAHYIGFLSPKTFDFLPGFNPLIIVVFGGLGSMTGSLVASIGWIWFLEGFLRVLLSYLGTEAPTWRYVLYPITLLLMMLLRPQGLLGTVEWGILKVGRIAKRLGAASPPAPGGETAAPKGGS
jgi:branched-chain amino acid transport system permease protein